MILLSNAGMSTFVIMSRTRLYCMKLSRATLISNVGVDIFIYIRMISQRKNSNNSANENWHWLLFTFFCPNPSDTQWWNDIKKASGQTDTKQEKWSKSCPWLCMWTDLRTDDNVCGIYSFAISINMLSNGLYFSSNEDNFGAVRVIILPVYSPPRQVNDSKVQEFFPRDFML